MVLGQGIWHREYRSLLPFSSSLVSCLLESISIILAVRVEEGIRAPLVAKLWLTGATLVRRTEDRM